MQVAPVTSSVRFFGADANDRTGGSLGSGIAVGDLNGDGFDDIAFGAFRAASVGNARPDAGEVTVVYGKATPWTQFDLQAPPAGVTRFWGATSGEMTGGGGLAFGDLNGDDFDDLIIGIWRSDSLGGLRPGAGHLHVIYGKATQWTDTDLLAPSAGTARFWGDDPGDQLGISVAVGDINGDGFDDIIAGADGAESLGDSRFSFAGETVIVLGRSTPWTDTDLRSPPPPGLVWLWGETGQYGNTVASADVNGDGFDDVIVGAISFPRLGGGASKGAAFVTYGHSDPWTDLDMATLPDGKDLR